jgi:hypothetical protein
VRELQGGGTNKMLGARQDLMAQLGYGPLLLPAVAEATSSSAALVQPTLA